MLSSTLKSLRYHLPELKQVSLQQGSLSLIQSGHIQPCVLSHCSCKMSMDLGVLSFAVTGCVFEGSTAGEGHGK